MWYYDDLFQRSTINLAKALKLYTLRQHLAQIYCMILTSGYGRPKASARTMLSLFPVPR